MVPVHAVMLKAHASSKRVQTVGEERHLVLVRYELGHPLFSAEWVYNEADIDDSTVAWARDMSPEENQELIDYFCDRQVWLLEGR